MDMCCLCSSAADKLPLLAMPVLVKQKLVQEAVTHLHLWCDHSERHGCVSLFSLHHTASYMILQLFARRALLNQVQWYCHISEPPTLLKPYTRQADTRCLDNRYCAKLSKQLSEHSRIASALYFPIPRYSTTSTRQSETNIMPRMGAANCHISMFLSLLVMITTCVNVFQLHTELETSWIQHKRNPVHPSPV